MDKRNLTLTHKQLELIIQALNDTGNRGLEIVKDLRRISKSDVAKEVADIANDYFKLIADIQEGKLDI